MSKMLQAIKQGSVDSSIFQRVIILKDFYSEKSFYSKGLLFQSFFFVLKGHYSEDFYPEGSLFWRFLSWRVIIPKIVIQKSHYSEFRNNDPTG